MMEHVPIASIAAAMAVIAVTAGIIGTSPPLAHAATNANIAAGSALAERACSACHQVDSGKPRPALLDADGKKIVVAAPSFLSIARERGTDANHLRSVITRPLHYPLPEPLIGDEDLDSLIAYILSLRASVP